MDCPYMCIPLIQWSFFFFLSSLIFLNPQNAIFPKVTNIFIFCYISMPAKLLFLGKKVKKLRGVT